jgi:hypothetical protein
MQTERSASPSRRRRRYPIGVALTMLIVLALNLVAAPSDATSTTSGWLASTVTADGSVIDPYGTDPSIDWTVNVALALSASADQVDALGRSADYIRANASDYLTSGSSDPAGHIAWLILLATRIGDDPREFGDAHLDLISALRDRFGVEEDGLFGTVDIYTSTSTQALAILALLAAGAGVETGAVDWLLQQQCTGPVGQLGAWQGHRAAVSPGVLEDCLPTSSAAYERADSATTSLAVLAIAAWRNGGGSDPAVDAAIDPAISGAVSWLRSMQATTGTAAGGFGQYVGDPADPNSTAMVIVAASALGLDPSSWTVTGGDPLSSLRSWIISSGPDTGALSSPYSAGSADLFATYQGLWGIVETFPFGPIVLPVAVPTPDPEAPTPELVTPRFTG